jgi:hypothetical protein
MFTMYHCLHCSIYLEQLTISEAYRAASQIIVIIVNKGRYITYFIHTFLLEVFFADM